MNAYLRLVFLFWVFPGLNAINAQILVNTGIPHVNMVQNLQAPGTQISNIQIKFDHNSFTDSPLGEFTDPYGVLGLDKGLLLTSGSAKSAEGPNNSVGISQNNGSSLGYKDPDLQTIISSNIFDQCIVEFDIISSYNELSYEFVFGSEEYPDFVTYDDGFGIFVTGPGIAGTKNIALVPSTGQPITVSTISPYDNTQYYVSNGNGTTPFLNPDLQYDGHTKRMTASTPIQACQTYHVKIAIADGGKAIYDAGVFVQYDRTLTNLGPELSVVYEQPGFYYALEDCNDAKIIVKRSQTDPGSMAQTLKYPVSLVGAALRNADYTVVLGDSVTIPANTLYIEIPFTILPDMITEGEEQVTFQINSICPGITSLGSISFPIRDAFVYPFKDLETCSNNTIPLNEKVLTGYDFLWDTDPLLSCTACANPMATLPANHTFYVSVTHTASGCQSRDSLAVSVLPISASFIIQQPDCYTGQDIQLVNTSTHADVFFWNFGDGKESEEVNPLHYYDFFSVERTTRTYTITLTAVSTDNRCETSTSQTFLLNRSVFIPNLITPNGDQLNDTFAPEGLTGDCWKLRVFNRWGDLVYKANKYDGTWGGENLNDGVYYFLIENAAEDRRFKGQVSILK